MDLKLSLVAAAIVMMLSLSGCGNTLDRPCPSREDYVATYLECFDATQIEKLDYVYQGAIGGTMTVGRAEFHDFVKLKDSLVAARVESGRLVAETYDPAEMAEGAAATEFRRQWEIHAGGTLPSWFDFPFDRKLRVLREVSEGSEGHPPHETVWYIDDERKIVYIRGNWG